MKILKSELKQLSLDAKLNISDKYIDIIYDNFIPIINKLESTKKIDIQNVKALNMIFEENFETRMYEDENPIMLNKKDVLKNSKNKNDDFFIVKR